MRPRRRHTVRQDTSKRLLWLAILLGAGALLWSPGPASADAQSPDGALYFHQGGAAPTQHPAWMRWLPDAVPLSQISFPGTHDSMAFRVNQACFEVGLCRESTLTQSMNLTRQLQSGIRALDIRLKCRESNGQQFLGVYHGSQYLDAWFGDVITDVGAFLDANPTETVLMRIKNEAGAKEGACPSGGIQFRDVLNAQYLDTGWSRHFHLPFAAEVSESVPLGDVRGKIVILENVSHFTHAAIPYPDIQDQDDFQVDVVGEIDDKWAKARRHFDLTAREPADQMFINYLSGAGGLYPKDIAAGRAAGQIQATGVNDFALRYLLVEHHARTGIVMMDFPGAALIDAVMSFNWHLANPRTAAYQDITESFSHFGPSMEGTLAEAVEQFAMLMHTRSRVRWQIVGFTVFSVPGGLHHGFSPGSSSGGALGLSVDPHDLGFRAFAMTDVANCLAPDISSVRAAVDAGAGPIVDGDLFDRAGRLARHLEGAFPRYEWDVLSYREGASHFFYNGCAPIHDKGPWHGVGYIVFGHSGPQLTASIRPSPIEVEAGEETDFQIAVRADGQPVAGAVVDFYLDGAPIAQCQSVPVDPSAPIATCRHVFTSTNGGNPYVVRGVARAVGYGPGISDELSVSVDSAATTTVLKLPASSVSGETFDAQVEVTGNAHLAPEGDAIVRVNDTTVKCVLESASQRGVSACNIPVTLARGAYTLQATYSGIDPYLPSSSSQRSFTVNQAQSSVVVTPGTPRSVVGQGVIFEARAMAVAPGGGVPAGTIRFERAGVPIPECSSAPLSTGVAKCAVTFTSAGRQHISADYLGSEDFAPVTSPSIEFDVLPATTATTIETSVNPSVVGQKVTHLATVVVVSPGAGAPTGTVRFEGVPESAGCDAVPLIAVPHGAVAACTATYRSAGLHGVHAEYAGSPDFSGSDAPVLAQTVERAATSVTVTPSVNPSVTGQTVAFTAAVEVLEPGSGVPTGTVSFSIDGRPHAACTDVRLVDAKALCSVRFAHARSTPVPITAEFSGDDNYLSDDSPFAHTVERAATELALTRSVARPVTGQSLDLIATLAVTSPGSGDPAGGVRFTIDAEPVAGCDSVPLAGGVARCRTRAPRAGASPYQVAARYGGSGDFLASSSAGELPVDRAATAVAVASSPSPSMFGAPVILTADVSVVEPGRGVPTGTIVFSTGHRQLGTVPLQVEPGSSVARATMNVASLPPGNSAISATYSGDLDFVGAAGGLAHSVTFTRCVDGASGPVVVGDGEAVCIGPSAVVDGGVTVEPGGAVAVLGGTVHGGLRAASPLAVALCNARVDGGLEIVGAAVVVLVGDGSESCVGNEINGGVELSANDAEITLAGNTIAGSVFVNDNARSADPSFGATPAGPLVMANRVWGKLECLGNDPPPSNGGRPNEVSGRRSGQCGGAF